MPSQGMLQKDGLAPYLEFAQPIEQKVVLESGSPGYIPAHGQGSGNSSRCIISHRSWAAIFNCPSVFPETLSGHPELLVHHWKNRAMCQVQDECIQVLASTNDAQVSRQELSTSPNISIPAACQHLTPESPSLLKAASCTRMLVGFSWKQFLINPFRNGSFPRRHTRD